jgi:hypothetical protein
LPQRNHGGISDASHRGLTRRFPERYGVAGVVDVVDVAGVVDVVEVASLVLCAFTSTTTLSVPLP